MVRLRRSAEVKLDREISHCLLWMAALDSLGVRGPLAALIESQTQSVRRTKAREIED